MRVEDVYANKFHKEPYIMHHIYAQYFHPDTLLERVRAVRFYRQPRTIFKGFKVPDWATAKEQHGWEVDAYSRQAWENAMQDMYSEWTPTPFAGERQEPNPLQWLRMEQWGSGYGSRLFYNEVPKLEGVKSWWSHGGHLLANPQDKAEQHRRLHSFTHANQDTNIVFGLDTTTPEGREAFKAEWDTLCELAPEIVKKEDLIFPHEQPPHLSNEPHFRRVWQHYREHTFRLKFAQLIDGEGVTQADADAFNRFVGMNGSPAFNIYIMARAGKMDHMKDDQGFQATMRVLAAMGFDTMEFTIKSSKPLEEQFWEQFDGMYELTETEMKSDLELFVTDPNNRSKVEALIASRQAQLD